MLSHPDRKRVSLDTGPDGPVRQSFKDECDVRKIIAQFQRTGVVVHTNPKPPAYIEVPNIDLQTALNIVRQGDEAFAALPAEVRQDFGNADNLVLALHDPAENDRLRRLGIIAPEEPAGGPPAPAEAVQGG